MGKVKHPDFDELDEEETQIETEFRRLWSQYEKQGANP